MRALPSGLEGELRNGNNGNSDGNSDEVFRPAPKPKCQGTNASGDPCGNYALPGRHHCRDHGGLTPTGMQRPAGAVGGFKDGKQSTYLPQKIEQRFLDFYGQPHWVELREEIALFNTRISFLKERLENGDSTASRKLLAKWLKKAYEKHEHWLTTGDPGPTELMELANEFRDMIDYIENTGRQDEVWDDIAEWTARTAKLKEVEVKRMVAANQVLTVTESYALITRLAAFIEEHIKDVELRGKAVRELHKLLNRN